MAKNAKKTTTPAKGEVYLNHRAGSRKSKVHQVFDKEGKEKALIFGKKQGLKESSVRSWISSWNRADAKAKAAKKKAAAPKKAVAAKKPATKKSNAAAQAAAA